MGVDMETEVGLFLCILISTPLLKALRNSGFGMNFKGALSSHRVIFMAYVFVDDTDLIETTKFPHDDFKEVLL